MAVIDLETVRENLEYMLEEFRQIPKPARPTIEYCEACLLAWRRSRRYGVAMVLTQADSAAFFSALVSAAEIRRDLLAATAAEAKKFAEYRHAGDLAGFADALAAGRLDLAKGIAALSTDGWQEDYEYEDDFRYAEFLHTFVGSDFTASERCRASLDALLVAAEGDATPAWQVGDALLARDRERFATGLAARVAEHRAWFAKKGEGMIAEPDEYATERNVFVEGLALKFLARKLGLAVADEEPLMPREAWIGAV